MSQVHFDGGYDNLSTLGSQVAATRETHHHLYHVLFYAQLDRYRAMVRASCEFWCGAAARRSGPDTRGDQRLRRSTKPADEIRGRGEGT